MARSMTGFTTQSVTLLLDSGDKVSAAISIKSLNSRFFEANCRLPFVLSNLETDIIRFLKKQLHRGCVYFSIAVPDQNVFKSAVLPALSIAKSYVDSAAQIQKECDLKGAIELSDIIKLPNVFIAHEQTITETCKKNLFCVIESIANQLVAEQEKEGAVLVADLKQRVTFIKKEIAYIEQETIEFMERKKVELAHELQTLQMEENRLLELHKSALYLIIDKIDIHEELVRFKSHLANLEQQLESSEVEKGKKLDFTIQELNREINTIAAKCNQADISKRAINIKVELEKTREQAQNIV